MVAIIDYGVGNIFSVFTAVRNAGGEPFYVRGPEELRSADSVILPGVGAFGDGMEQLNRSGLTDAIREGIRQGKPFLGLCLGMQILFSWSDEGRCAGLDVVPGRVVRFSFPGAGLTVPHMGWNQVRQTAGAARLFTGIPDDSYFFFAHSYFAVPEQAAVVGGTTQYGREFCSVVAAGNVYGVQFHPEKSGAAGLRLVTNFVGM